MSRLATLFVGFSLVGAFGANLAMAADDKIDVTGTWNVEIELAGQSGKPVFTFKQEGEKLSGKYMGQFGEADVTGTLKGNAIEFSFEAQGAKVVYKGTVDKDTMKGQADYAGQAMGDWKAKKKAA